MSDCASFSLHSRIDASRLVLNALIDVDHLPEDASVAGRSIPRRLVGVASEQEPAVGP